MTNIWQKNGKVFQKYFPGKFANKSDRHLMPIGLPKKDSGFSWDELKDKKHIVGILQPGYIDISFDYDDPERIQSMIEANEWNCAILLNKASNHIHTLWRMPNEWKSSASMANVQLACGVLADIHYKLTAIPLRVNGNDRLTVYDAPMENGEYQTVPLEFFPVTEKGEQKDPGLLGMIEHDGRDNALSRWCMKIYKYLYKKPFQFDREDIREICGNINTYIFKQPLEENALENILRDETFEKIESQSEKNPQKEVSALPKPMTAQELMCADLAPTEFIIKNLLPIGLSILASPPKYGKSWMCLDMALSVAAGQDFLGYKTEKCGVVYFALEDSFNRLQGRMKAVLKGKRTPNGLMLYTLNDSEGNRVENLDTGFLEQLESVISDYPDTKFIIIDTFVRIQGGTKRNESAYQAESRQAGALQSFAMKHGVAVLVVTHTRKNIDPNDEVANITGTTGLPGVADVSIVFAREKRSDSLTKMAITGRDVDSESIPITFNKQLSRWERQGMTWEDTVEIRETERKLAEYQSSNIQKTIHALLDENNGKWTGSTTAIVKKSNINGTPIEKTPTALGKYLTNMNGIMLLDGVIHTIHTNGSGAKKHEFTYSNCQKNQK